MSRVNDLRFEALTPEQQRVYQQISGPRGGTVGGPYIVWLRNPDLAAAMNRVFEVLRLNGKLDKRLMELAALIVAKFWSCNYIWVAHERSAIELGLPRGLVEAIREDRTPDIPRQDERIVYDAVTELCRSRTLSDSTYERAIGLLGLDTLIELITNVARYTQAAMVSNAFDLPAAGGQHPLSRLQKQKAAIEE